MSGYVPKPGFDFNPLRHYRNLPCPCGSNKKIKKCHGQLNLMPIEDIEKAKFYLRNLAAAGFIEAKKGHIT